MLEPGPVEDGGDADGPAGEATRRRPLWNMLWGRMSLVNWGPNGVMTGSAF